MHLTIFVKLTTLLLFKIRFHYGKKLSLRELPNASKIREKSEILRWPLLALAYKFLPRLEGIFYPTFGG